MKEAIYLYLSLSFVSFFFRAPYPSFYGNEAEVRRNSFFSHIKVVRWRFPKLNSYSSNALSGIDLVRVGEVAASGYFEPYPSFFANVLWRLCCRTFISFNGDKGFALVLPFHFKSRVFRRVYVHFNSATEAIAIRKLNFFGVAAARAYGTLHDNMHC